MANIYEEDIELTKEDAERIKSILKKNTFNDFVIHPYFFREKFTQTISNEPRHNVSLEELKEIYPNFHLIKRGFKRKGIQGFKYTLFYDESKNVFVKVSFLLDEMPMKIFQAIRIYRNLDKAVARKYGLII